jgi:hypothetical protein
MVACNQANDIVTLFIRGIYKCQASASNWTKRFECYSTLSRDSVLIRGELNPLFVSDAAPNILAGLLKRLAQTSTLNGPKFQL